MLLFLDDETTAPVDGSLILTEDRDIVSTEDLDNLETETPA
jgi:hypothetical protein